MAKRIAARLIILLFFPNRNSYLYVTRGHVMRIRSVVLGSGLLLPLLAAATPASAQDGTLRAKSGEVIDLRPVFRQINCRGMLLATPEVEVLQGPPELTLSVRDEMVEVPDANCPKKIKGAMVVVTVGQLSHPVEGRLIFRVKYRGRYRNTQTGHAYDFSLSQ
jgi:hypothetical protein